MQRICVAADGSWELMNKRVKSENIFAFFMVNSHEKIES